MLFPECQPSPSPQSLAMPLSIWGPALQDKPSKPGTLQYSKYASVSLDKEEMGSEGRHLGGRQCIRTNWGSSGRRGARKPEVTSRTGTHSTQRSTQHPTLICSAHLKLHWDTPVLLSQASYEPGKHCAAPGVSGLKRAPVGKLTRA